VETGGAHGAGTDRQYALQRGRPHLYRTHPRDRRPGFDGSRALLPRHCAHDRVFHAGRAGRRAARGHRDGPRRQQDRRAVSRHLLHRPRRGCDPAHGGVRALGRKAPLALRRERKNHRLCAALHARLRGRLALRDAGHGSQPLHHDPGLRQVQHDLHCDRRGDEHRARSCYDLSLPLGRLRRSNRDHSLTGRLGGGCGVVPARKAHEAAPAPGVSEAGLPAPGQSYGAGPRALHHAGDRGGAQHRLQLLAAEIRRRHPGRRHDDCQHDHDDDLAAGQRHRPGRAADHQLQLRRGQRRARARGRPQNVRRRVRLHGRAVGARGAVPGRVHPYLQQQAGARRHSHLGAAALHGGDGAVRPADGRAADLHGDRQGQIELVRGAAAEGHPAHSAHLYSAALLHRQGVRGLSRGADCGRDLRHGLHDLFPDQLPEGHAETGGSP